MSGCNIIRKINDENASNNKTQEVSSRDNNNSEVKPAPKPIDPIMEQIAKMSIDEKIGQMVVVGIEGYDLNDNTKSLIEKSKVGGVILFSNNYSRY